MKHIFIVNTHAGDGRFSEKLRRTLSELHESEGFEYFIFNTRKKVKEDRLIRKIVAYFAGERLRVYSCGGSGTFRNILNNVEDLDNVEFAFFPCGMTNDFLKVFGDDERFFHDIRNLIHGQVRMVDYIQTNHGRALNTFSIGMDTDTLEGMERYRPYATISGNTPYLMATLAALVWVKNIEYEVCFGGEVHEGPMSEVFFGNGCYIGGNVKFGTERCCNNGRASVFLGPKTNFFTILPHVLYATSERTEKTAKFGAYLGYATELTIKRKDGKKFAMDFDGEFGNPHAFWKARLVPRGIQFVVPPQVTRGFVGEEA